MGFNSGFKGLISLYHESYVKPVMCTVYSDATCTE